MIRASAVALVVVLASACSLVGGSGAGETFTDRLSLVPTTAVTPKRGDAMLVDMADLDRAAQLAGVEHPADPADAGAVIEYVNALAGEQQQGGGRPMVSALVPESATLRLDRVDEFHDELGWSIADVSWFVEHYELPNSRFALLGGRFDEQRLTEAMGPRNGGIWHLGGQDGSVDPDEPTAARGVGESLRLALDEGRLLLGATTPPVVAAANGTGRTLADDPVFVALAEAMDGQGAYSARFYVGADRTPTAFGINSAEVDVALEEGWVMPEPFSGLAGGAAVNGDQPVVVLAYAHDDAAAAEANAAHLRRLIEEGPRLPDCEWIEHRCVPRPGGAYGERRWSSFLRIDDVRVDDATLVARLSLGDRGYPAMGHELVAAWDLLSIHSPGGDLTTPRPR